jgi:hypothetical protein
VIFRRTFIHVTNHNWAAVGVELLVVVVGVFVGLQASNWNDERLERAQERDYLIHLHEDISDSAAGLKNDIAAVENQLSAQAIILTALNECVVQEEDQEIIQLGFASLGHVNPPRFFRRTVDELTSSGRLHIVQSTDLKAELARIVALLEYREKVQETVFRRMEHHLNPVQAQLQFDLSTPIDGYPNYPTVTFDIQKLCKHPENAAAISTISFISRSRLEASKQLLALYVEFMPKVENELQTRWNYEMGSE